MKEDQIRQRQAAGTRDLPRESREQANLIIILLLLILLSTTTRLLRIQAERAYHVNEGPRIMCILPAWIFALYVPC